MGWGGWWRRWGEWVKGMRRVVMMICVSVLT
jgi:hypothetical protein